MYLPTSINHENISLKLPDTFYRFRVINEKRSSFQSGQPGLANMTTHRGQHDKPPKKAL